MSTTHTDLLVIGGGATGAAVALSGVRRGLSVVLVEAGDLAGGTSCRSTKLLHGGVRYLELAFKTFDAGQLRLVREALLERGHWLDQVPFLARPLELALPTGQPLATLYYRIGLGLYDALAGRRAIAPSRAVSGGTLQRLLPGLSSRASGAVLYSDGQFDDARLNLLLALTAAAEGADVRSHCRARELLLENGRVGGALVEQGGRCERIEAGVVVNATGLAADAVRHMADPDAPPRLQTSRGVHVVLEQNLCPEGAGLLVPSTDDGRVLFMLPFHGRTLVGTTDTPCQAAEVNRASPQERDYLLDYVARWFPNRPVTVSAVWAGGRPLLQAAGGPTGNTAGLVREHEVETLPSGLISVMGGKWTTCRPMAHDTLQAVERQLGRSLPAEREAPVLGAVAGGAAAMAEPLHRCRQDLLSQLPAGVLQEAQADHLIASHGLRADRVLACAETPAELEPLSPAVPLCAAEIRHGIRHEQARSAVEVLARRCRLAMVDQAEARRLAPLVEELLDREGHPPTPAGAAPGDWETLV
ncbi:FAD-dependent oxidoreductase [Synechococcus sp. RSCCF101]|uniref:glycerol-3-phosphate dehydrogenase/oxidase n=1 Tax=Synechococcus sp. RSCCF101 TaxID=2511069 RepID=UPI001246A9E5|nr:FAD-dependent oxidoreductase [Synechococcus sp. RSCCF101]QEY32094.1 FAD-dependent oxidoreductase [Synechococcus sp. RSCCF101]